MYITASLTSFDTAIDITYTINCGITYFFKISGRLDTSCNKKLIVFAVVSWPVILIINDNMTKYFKNNFILYL